MAEHNIKATLIQKCKSSDEWDAYKDPSTDSAYVPKVGEIVIYSDLNKMKVGNGRDDIGELPFIDGNIFGENGITKITDSLEIIGDQISGKKLTLSEELNINNSKAIINSGGNISGTSVTVTGDLTSGQKVSGATAAFSSNVQVGALGVTGKSTLGEVDASKLTVRDSGSTTLNNVTAKDITSTAIKISGENAIVFTGSTNPIIKWGTTGTQTLSANDVTEMKKQADWLANDSTKGDYIKNKPSIQKGVGNNSLVGGIGTTATEANQTSLGSYNKGESTAKLIVGCGTSSVAQNCFSTGKNNNECYIKIGNAILTESMLSQMLTFFGSVEAADDFEI